MPAFMRYMFYTKFTALPPPPPPSMTKTVDDGATDATTTNDETALSSCCTRSYCPHENNSCSDTVYTEEDEDYDVFDSFWFFKEEDEQTLNNHSPFYIPMCGKTTRLRFREKSHELAANLTRSYYQRNGGLYLTLNDLGEAVFEGDFSSTEILNWLALVPDDVLNSENDDCRQLLTRILTVAIARFRMEISLTRPIDAPRTLTFVAPRVSRAWLYVEADTFYNEIAVQVFTLPQATLYSSRERYDGLDKRNTCSWFSIFLAKISYDFDRSNLREFHTSSSEHLTAMFHRCMDAGCPFLALPFSLFVQRDCVYGRCQILYDTIRIKRRYVNALDDTEYSNLAAINTMLAIRYDASKFVSSPPSSPPPLDDDMEETCSGDDVIHDYEMPHNLDDMVGLSFAYGLVKTQIFVDFVKRIFEDSLNTKCLHRLCTINGLSEVIATTCEVELPVKKIIHCYVYGTAWRFLCEVTTNKE